MSPGAFMSHDPGGAKANSACREEHEDEAGEENRTPVVSLEGFCSAIELRPREHSSLPPRGYHAAPMERLITRTAGLCSRRPWWVVAVWAILVAASLPFAGKAQGRLS